MVDIFNTNTKELATSGVMFRMLGLSRDVRGCGGGLFAICMFPPQEAILRQGYERHESCIGYMSAIQLNDILDIDDWLSDYFERQPHLLRGNAAIDLRNDEFLKQPVRVGRYVLSPNFPAFSWFRFVDSPQGVCLEVLLTEERIIMLLQQHRPLDYGRLIEPLKDALRVSGSNSIEELDGGYLYREPSYSELFSDVDL